MKTHLALLVTCAALTGCYETEQQSGVEVLIVSKQKITNVIQKTPTQVIAEVITVSEPEGGIVVPLEYQGRFRIIQSNDGLYGIEVLGAYRDGVWTEGPTYNVFRTKGECQRDVDWWCGNWDGEKVKAARVWLHK